MTRLVLMAAISCIGLTGTACGSQKDPSGVTPTNRSSWTATAEDLALAGVLAEAGMEDLHVELGAYNYDTLDARIQRYDFLSGVVIGDVIDNDVQAAAIIRVYNDNIDLVAMPMTEVGETSIETLLSSTPHEIAADLLRDRSSTRLDGTSAFVSDTGLETVGLLFRSTPSLTCPTSGAVSGGPICTGVVVNNRVIITAAHCVEALIPSGNIAYTSDTLQVYYGDDFELNGCGSHAYPVSGNWANAFYYRDPSYAGTGDVAHDFGVIVLDDALPLPSNKHYRGRFFVDTSPFAPGPGTTYAYGYGRSNTFFDSGVRRRAPFNWTPGTGSILTTFSSAAAQICSGDSGGPLMRVTGGRFLTTATTSASFSTLPCSPSGTLERATVTRNHWAQLTYAAILGGEPLTCYDYTTSTGLDYRRCSN